MYASLCTRENISGKQKKETKSTIMNRE